MDKHGKVPPYKDNTFAVVSLNTAFGLAPLLHTSERWDFSERMSQPLSVHSPQQIHHLVLPYSLIVQYSLKAKEVGNIKSLALRYGIDL